MSATKWKLDSTGVLIISIAAFVLPILFIETRVLNRTFGIIAYPIDDTFIHLTIAKNIAFHGIWGITSNEFVSAASSLLYPLLLALIIKIAGANIVIPLLVNVAAGIVLLIVLRKWLEKQQLGAIGQLVVLLSIIFFTPLPIIAISGMEHILQFLFTFLFISRFSEELARGRQQDLGKWWFSWPLYAYASLMTATRYEGLIILAVACFILLIHRRIWLAFQLGLLGALPVLLFGFFSISNGNFFIPNSVLLKSGAPPLTIPGITSFLTGEFLVKLFSSLVGYNFAATQRLLLLLPVCLLLFCKQLRERQANKYMLLILSTAVFLHLTLTGYAHFPRYEAYLIGCSVAVLGLLFTKYGPALYKNGSSLSKWLTGLLAAFALGPLFLRSANIFGDIEQACVNIFDMQFQMGQFLHQYYYNDQVAIGDIGAVSYYTAGRKMDLNGLGDIKVARSRKGHYDNPNFLDSLSRQEGVKLAIVFEHWTDANLTQRWTKVADWTIPNNVACGSSVVSFFAVEKEVAPGLKTALQKYQKTSLPSDVEVDYY